MYQQSNQPGDPVEANAPPQIPEPTSPPWSNTTKLVVALTLVAVVAGFFISFRNIVGPLLMAFLLAYVLYPTANYIRSRLPTSWRVSVTLIYVVLFIIILGVLIWGGFVLVDQILALIKFLDRQVANLPALINDLTSHPLQIGPFILGLGTAELQGILTQLFGAVQPLFTQVGGLVGGIASSAAVLIGWTLFVLLISYFILAELEGVPGEIFALNIPHYQQDIDRMKIELGRIWNAFLRGQLIIFLLTILIYSILLAVLGVRYFYGLALLAGLARFVPYVGPAITWTAYGLVAYFQGSTFFGLSPLVYALIVVGIALFIDTIMDNFVTVRVLGSALRVHPAMVMVAAIVGATLLGVIGVVLAAPVLATLKLFFGYAFRKLSDQDPWEGMDISPPTPRPLLPGFGGLWRRAKGRWRRLRGHEQPEDEEAEEDQEDQE